ncbi:MAG TPA: GntR family transcriptional regulator [Paracoccus sp. (in: a-proteobacteria)]|uniref:GntR family transcriptional regulator n=1 Tax=Paracoccus sp. TaxID=267 RepID=UPI002BF8CEC8|nr:GntR family transcriptional regulator [Paracoccus sp. (in: a-proteobacteria)]HWL56997.1 GntR family transcriptional regulator [Paracoccus sp. (in: a-proteobacteria)]
MRTDLGQIESATIQVQVYNRLREALFTGKLLPGESLTIRNLAAMLGISPMPVREALQRLVAEHALTQLPNRTFCVTPFTATMFRELMRVRMTVEGLAANQAVRRITPETIARLRDINREMIEGVEAGVPTVVMTANRAFHFTLYESAEMPQLFDIINGLWLRAGPYLMNAHRKLDNPTPFLRAGTLFHQRIITACENGMPSAAARAIAGDIWHSARYFRRNVDLINEVEPPPAADKRRGRRKNEPKEG